MVDTQITRISDVIKLTERPYSKSIFLNLDQKSLDIDCIDIQYEGRIYTFSPSRLGNFLVSEALDWVD